MYCHPRWCTYNEFSVRNEHGNHAMMFLKVYFNHFINVFVCIPSALLHPRTAASFLLQCCCQVLCGTRVARCWSRNSIVRYWCHDIVVRWRCHSRVAHAGATTVLSGAAADYTIVWVSWKWMTPTLAGLTTRWQEALTSRMSCIIFKHSCYI